MLLNAFQKISCKLAVQLFNKSVSVAIKTFESTNKLQSLSVLYTIEFVDIINDMFDTYNSKNLYDPNLSRKPVCDKNPATIKICKKPVQYFKKQ